MTHFEDEHRSTVLPLVVLVLFGISIATGDLLHTYC